MAKSKWTEEMEATIVAVVGEVRETAVPFEQVAELAVTLEKTERAVASKLRSMGYPVDKKDSVRTKTFTDEQEVQLVEFVNAHPGEFTHAEIAAALFGDSIGARQVQGKLLYLDMLDMVKPTEHVEAPKRFSAEQEAVFIKMANSGAFIEDIAATLGVENNVIRGKALSLFRKELIQKIPAQRVVKVYVAKDILEDVEDIENKTTKELAEEIGKTERGVKTILTKRGLKCSDYNGEMKAAKIAERKVA